MLVTFVGIAQGLSRFIRFSPVQACYGIINLTFGK